MLGQRSQRSLVLLAWGLPQPSHGIEDTHKMIFCCFAVTNQANKARRSVLFVATSDQEIAHLALASLTLTLGLDKSSFNR